MAENEKRILRKTTKMQMENMKPRSKAGASKGSKTFH